MLQRMQIANIIKTTLLAIGKRASRKCLNNALNLGKLGKERHDNIFCFVLYVHNRMHDEA